MKIKIAKTADGLRAALDLFLVEAGFPGWARKFHVDCWMEAFTDDSLPATLSCFARREPAISMSIPWKPPPEFKSRGDS